jgi:hypothetical protein
MFQHPVPVIKLKEVLEHNKTTVLVIRANAFDLVRQQFLVKID